MQEEEDTDMWRGEQELGPKKILGDKRCDKNFLEMKRSEKSFCGRCSARRLDGHMILGEVLRQPIELLVC
jgi:hypothetical protein